MALNPYSGQVTQGLRGDMGGENAFWGTDPSGKEVPALLSRGGDNSGQFFLLPDLLGQYGSIEGIRAAGAMAPNQRAGGDGTDNYNPYYGAGNFEQSLDLFGARPNNDTFSGKDGLRDAITIAAMAAPVAFGAAGAAGATSAGAGGEAALGSGLTAGSGAGGYLGAGGADALGLGSGVTPSAGAGGYLGAGGSAEALGLGGGISGSLGAGTLGYASPTVAGGTPSAGAGPSAQSAGVSSATAPASATPAAGTGAAGAQAGGQSFVDNLLSQMKNNALGLGLMTAGTAASLSAGRTQIPNQQQIQGLGTEAAGVAKQLIAQYQSGTLQPGQQASLDQLTQNTKNQLRQYFASIGQADSTAAVQAMAQVDQQALAMKQQVLDTALQQGLSAIGVAQGPLNSIAQYQLGQDAQLRQAFGAFAGSVGNLFGRNSGTPQQPTTSAQAKPVVTSTQTPTA